MQTSYITNNAQGIPILVDGNINLESSQYNITLQGIYEIININGSTNQINFNLLYPASSGNDGQIIIIANKDLNFPANTDLPEYPLIPSGEVWKFVSNGIQWLKVPTPGAMYANGSFPAADEIELPSAGVYVFYTNKPSVTLPNASLYNGQTIILFNPQNTNTNVYGGVFDLENNYNNPFMLGAYSMLKLKSVGGNWRIVKYSQA